MTAQDLGTLGATIDRPVSDGVPDDAEMTLMSTIVSKTPNPPQTGDIVEGNVIAREKTTIYVDIGIFGTGIIYGREYLTARDLVKKMRPGDILSAKVVDQENEDGYIELSLREAKEAQVWRDAELATKERRTFDLVVKDANRGGLMFDWQGLVGFLPASQLTTDHYPRVLDGDKEKIFEELKKLVGQVFTVSIITAEPEDEKLIFSEKTQSSPERQKIISKYEVGDVVESTVTGAVDFGIFVKIEEGLEGLVHISELDWALVENPRDLYKLGDSIKAKIIEIKDDKISLSIKALKNNPWKDATLLYKRGQDVEGVVIKFNKYGALVSIREGVAGLIHISEFESADQLHNTLELGKTYTFRITLFEPKEQKLTLSLSAEEDTANEPHTDSDIVGDASNTNETS